MATPKTLSLSLAELRDVGRTRHRRAGAVDAIGALARLVSACRTVSVDARASGLSFRLHGQTEQLAAYTLTCILHAPTRARLTTAEAAVVELLCDGRTRREIALLRGVSVNTVKSQIRQIFRKLDVESRVALVRHWCP
jgi:DNA-binding NarL/FixJ family response regulator